MTADTVNGGSEQPSLPELEQQGYQLLAHAVGDAAVAGSYLEDALANLLSAMIGNPDVDAIASGLSCDQMIQDCKALLRDGADFPGRERTSAALQLAKSAYVERSDVVHAVWANLFKAEHGLIAIRVRRRQKGFTPKAWSLDEIHEVAAGVRAATREVAACLYGYATGDFTQQATTDPSYAAFETTDGNLVVLNDMGVDKLLWDSDVGPPPSGDSH